MRVTDMASGQAYIPEHAIKTMPQKTAPGVKHYFYARGKYEIALPPGRYQIEVARGICHELAIGNAEVGRGTDECPRLRHSGSGKSEFANWGFAAAARKLASKANRLHVAITPVFCKPGGGGP
jgi:hypothetical protein